LSQLLHIPLFGRPITKVPWDKFPSDEWLPPDETFVVIFLSSIVLIAFSLSFSAGWHFYFPTPAERLLWRMCSVYHAVASLAGGIYYLWGPREIRQRQYHVRQQGVLENSSTIPEKRWRRWRTRVRAGRIARIIHSWRNISPDQNPDMAIPLRSNFPVFIGCFLYGFCRIYFYVEDFIGLRQQPVGVFQTVNEFIPFTANLK
jgi:hypothetical protein